VSRRVTDTYYKDKDHVLRPHTSCYEIPFLKAGHTSFLVLGDVYRKDTVDKTHYPVFHQLEGVRSVKFEDIGAKDINEAKIISERDLRQTLENLARHMFGDVEMKWSYDNFPFTEPSVELEVNYNGEWLEILGAGVLRDKVMINGNKNIH
jgi:phenylalanyl-tRNA synthetase alpha chain